jgi:Heparinase II/III-like protein
VLTVRGLPLLIDPGTATYTMDRAVRDRHRAARMHNTIVLDECDPSAPAGPFHWRSRADARMLVARTGRDMDFAAGAIAGRASVHVRAVLTLHGIGWLIVDRVAAKESTCADVWWHLHPMWSATPYAGGALVETSTGVRLGMAFSRGDATITRDPELAAVALEYGALEIGTAIRVRHAAAGVFTVASFIAERPLESRRPLIREVQTRDAASDGWARHTFAIEPGTGPAIMAELSFPDAREPQPDERWPQPCIRVGRAREMAVCAE